MRKSKFKIGTLVFAWVFATKMMAPLAMNGQYGGADGFFRGISDGYENRDEEIEVTGGISNESFTVPVGSGLLIMTAAGLGYAAVKRRKGKNIAALLMATALLAGLTQCRKNPNQVTPYNINMVSIRMSPDGGAKTNVNPATGEVTFEDGDEILVANGGRYVGKLSCEDGVFCGSIVNPVTNDYLHFYHIGNIEVESLVAGSTAECIFNITDQINSLPVISYGHSYEKYSSGTTSYEARLENKCALVKFDVSTPSASAATCVLGLKNKVHIYFDGAGFEYGVEDDGKILLPSGEGARWAILLPQDEMSAGEEGSAFSGRYVGHRGEIPEINIGEAYGGGVEVVMNTITQPEGALNGLFTVNDEGRQVVFSKANLSYVKADAAWRFLDEQYITVERDNNAYIGTNCSRLDVITLFEWGQSGYNHGAVSYLPYHTDVVQGDFYVYGDFNCSLYDHTGKADWGYNKIANGGMTNKQWRCLTGDELDYIFTGRQDAADKYAKATVVDNKGVVILPDEWEDPYDECFTGGDEVDFGLNDYTESEWRLMEENGAVFMPYAGSRNKDRSNGANRFIKLFSSTAYDKYFAYGLYSSASVVSLNSRYQAQRNGGMSVRLVTE